MTTEQDQKHDYYTIIEGDDFIEFIGKINALMCDGFEPIGGVSVVHEPYEGASNRYIYFQAMILNAPTNHCVSTFSIPCVDSSPAKPGSSPFDAG